MTEHTFMIIISIIIGILAGLGSILIRALIQEISNLSFPGHGSLLENITQTPWYWIVLLPFIGGLLTGPLIYFLSPEAKGSGVPEIIQSVLIDGGHIRKRVAIVKSIASAIIIGTGGSVGREGPIIHIGASLASAVGQFFQISGIRIKTLVGCGAAAGIAAAFNAPIAGALFAVEIILMDFAVARFSPIVISSVVATVVSRMFEGNFITFQIPPYQLVNPFELVNYTVLGLTCGLISFIFIKTLFYTEEWVINHLKLPGYLKPAIGGLLVGIIALAYPQVMGVGYDSINNALQGRFVWDLALILIFLKILATSFSLGSGGSGGVFAPSLFVGAMTGYCFGIVMNSLFPGATASPGAYALVAMGGIVAGTTRAPITAIIIIFEITNTYDIILPLMITCIISAVLSSKFSRESIYTMRLMMRKVNVNEGREINVMRSLFVRDIYSKRIEFISENESFGEVINELFSRESPYLIVIDEKKQMVGSIFLNNIRNSYFEWSELKDIIIAKEIASTAFSPVTLDDDCQDTLDKMIEAKLPGLPVIDSENRKRVLGMIWQKDILNAYHDEISRMNIAITLLDKVQLRRAPREVHYMQGRSIAEIQVPKQFIGHSIKDLNIRSFYGIDILSIQKLKDLNHSIDMFPDPDRIFHEDDEKITVAGKAEKLALLKNIT